MRQLHQKWQDQESEELLFQLIFKSLGYSVNTAAFEELARLYPYSKSAKTTQDHSTGIKNKSTEPLVWSFRDTVFKVSSKKP